MFYRHLPALPLSPSPATRAQSPASWPLSGILTTLHIMKQQYCKFFKCGQFQKKVLNLKYIYCTKLQWQLLAVTKIFLMNYNICKVVSCFIGWIWDIPQLNFALRPPPPDTVGNRKRSIEVSRQIQWRLHVCYM